MSNETIYVGSTFDLFHAGHINLLRQAAEIADIIVVAINGDEFTKKYKGEYPILNQDERKYLIDACKYVSNSFIMERHEDQPKHIKNINPDYILHGDDWTGDSLVKQLGIDREFLNKHDIQMKYVPYTKGISTTEIKNRVLRGRVGVDISHAGFQSPYIC